MENDFNNSGINTSGGSQNNDFAPNNYLRGFIGAIIGALVGAGISVVIYILGFISSISAVVAIVLGALLYEKFGGKLNIGMIIIVTLTSLIILAATVPAIYIVAAGIAAKNEGLSMSAFEAFKICMEDNEFSRMFYMDLAMVALFSIVGAAFEAFIIFKRIRNR